MITRRFFIVLLLVFSFYTNQQAQERFSVAEEMYGYVLGIEGSDNQKRKEFVIDQLRQMGIGYVVAPFTEKIITKPDSLGKRDTIIISGENIIARVGTGFKKIVIGAHYDTYENSPGANDNGSGVAVALALLNHFKDEEMKHTLEVCFFDKEEKGCFGSASYIKQFAIAAKHLTYINLDVVGTGDEVYIGPIGGGDDRIVMPIVREAMRKLPYKYVERAEFPSSDYLPFAAVGLENIAISVVPEGDARRLALYVKNNGAVADTIADFPRVLTAIHTSLDRSKYVSPHSLKMAFEFTREIILLLNRRR